MLQHKYTFIMLLQRITGKQLHTSISAGRSCPKNTHRSSFQVRNTSVNPWKYMAYKRKHQLSDEIGLAPTGHNLYLIADYPPTAIEAFDFVM